MDVATKAQPDIEQQIKLVHALRTCLQLQAWREKGLAPQLHSAPEGWVLILDTTKWGMQEVSERSREQLVRFCTAPCESPEAAIEAALRMVQP